jgi:hypothetical protein
MNVHADTGVKKSAPQIDLRTVPKHSLDWPACYRLRPFRIPADDTMDSFGEDSSLLQELRLMTAPTARHALGKAVLPTDFPAAVSRQVLAAFATSAPEWRFAQRGRPHLAVSSRISTALATGVEIYGQFMRDTAQPATRMSFILERYRLTATVADVSDQELFPKCYESQDHLPAQELVETVASAGIAAVVYAEKGGQSAVVIDPSALSYSDDERALTFEWDGSHFAQAYDYRDLFWRSLI